MTDKRKRPVVAGKLITSGLRSGFLEVGTGPATAVEFKVLSPTGIINCDMGGIGLGIVAALEKSSENTPIKKANFRRWKTEVNQPRNVGDTIVPEKAYTKVYPAATRKATERRNLQASIFDISSPARFGDDVKVYKGCEFLSLCYLCNKRLHGIDIYMYRGEKAFCSPECRSRQIGMEKSHKRREKNSCSSQVVPLLPVAHALRC